MSTFSGINLSSRALTAAQRAMEVTGQNIANVNTEGYTRQRVEQTEALAGATGTWARKDVPGDGVEITGITRVTDALVDAAARQDTATAAEHRTTTAVWTRLEQSLGEPDANGLSQQLSDMHQAWNDLGNATSTENVLAARTHVLARAQNVAATAERLDTQIQAQWTELRAQVDLHVADVNATAAQIAGYNAAIRQASATGSSSNELMDLRDKAVLHLSELTGARVVQRDAGTIDVYVGNSAVVTGTGAQRVAAVHSGSFADVKAGTGSTSLTVDGGGVLPTTGTLKAVLDAVNTTVPRVSADIDAAVQEIADRVNAVYNPGGPDSGDFFTFTSASVAGGGAAERIQVNPAITAASLTDSTPGTVDRARAKALGELPTTPDSPTLTWRATVVDIAARTQASEIRADLAAQVSLKSAGARDAVSGVNIDEEMTNLVAFQHAYAAAARVLTTIDQALDTLINRTGVVGR